MATVNVQATFCAGGGHASATLTVNGVAQGTWDFDYPDITGTPDNDARREFVRNFIRLHKIGKTDATLKSDLLAGITVTI